MNAYDYGFGELTFLQITQITLASMVPTVFPCGSHTSPGAQAGVPVIIPTEITVCASLLQHVQCFVSGAFENC